MPEDWVVWGPLADGRQMVVSEWTSQQDAEDDADHRNEVAAKYSFVEGYFALPRDVDPNEELT